MEKLFFTFRCSRSIETLDKDYKPEIPAVPIRAVNLSLVEISQIDEWWPSLGSGLTTLRLFDCKLEVARLVGMLRHTPNLAKLTLDSTEYTSLDCAVPDFHLDRLERLRIDEESMFQALIPICPRLNRLYLIRSLSLEGENGPMFCRLIENVRLTLDTLEFDLSGYGNQILFGGDKVSGETEPIFPNLKQLNIYFCKEIPDSHNIPLARYLATMPRLEELVLFTPHSVDFDGLNATHLEKISLHNLFSSDLESLARGAPKLRELVLDSGGLSWWGDVFDVIDTIPTLRRLEVTDPEPISYEPCLANARPNNLEDLHLTACNRFHVRLLNKFLKLSPQLKKLELIRMVMDDETIKIIGANLHKLEHLKLDIRGDVRKESAKYIIFNCLKLKKFKIYNDRMFHEVAKKSVEESQGNVVVEYFEGFNSD